MYLRDRRRPVLLRALPRSRSPAAAGPRTRVQLRAPRLRRSSSSTLDERWAKCLDYLFGVTAPARVVALRHCSDFALAPGEVVRPRRALAVFARALTSALVYAGSSSDTSIDASGSARKCGSGSSNAAQRGTHGHFPTAGNGEVYKRSNTPERRAAEI